MNYNTRLKEIVDEYLINHPNTYSKSWTCRVRGHINNQPVSIKFNCFDCDIISALDPDSMDDLFEISGANRISRLTGYSRKIGFIDLRIIIKNCPEINEQNK